jgi:hypothetical protein
MLEVRMLELLSVTVYLAWLSISTAYMRALMAS